MAVNVTFRSVSLSPIDNVFALHFDSLLLILRMRGIYAGFVNFLFDRGIPRYSKGNYDGLDPMNSHSCCTICSVMAVTRYSDFSILTLRPEISPNICSNSFIILNCCWIGLRMIRVSSANIMHVWQSWKGACISHLAVWSYIHTFKKSVTRTNKEKPDLPALFLT